MNDDELRKFADECRADGSVETPDGFVVQLIAVPEEGDTVLRGFISSDFPSKKEMYNRLFLENDGFSWGQFDEAFPWMSEEMFTIREQGRMAFFEFSVGREDDVGDPVLLARVVITMTAVKQGDFHVANKEEEGTDPHE